MAITPIIAPYDTPGLPYDDSTTRYYDGYPGGIPFALKVLLQDASGNHVAWLTNRIIRDSLSFKFNRLGGCAEGSLRLHLDDFFAYAADLADYRVLVYINSQGSQDYSLVYAGFITDDSPACGEPMLLPLAFKGFSDMATRLVAGMRADGTVQYGAPDPCQWAGGTALDDIVKALASALPDYVPIQYSATYIDDPGIDLVNVLSMQKTAWECFNDLAALAGNYQWGVDHNRYFYFKAPATSAHTFWYGAGVSAFSVSRNYSGIKNRCLVQDGSYTDTYEADDDLAVQQQQTLHADYIDCGSNASQAVRQTCVTDKRSISRVRLSAKMVGTASSNMVTDGDMELAGTTNWPQIFALTDEISKDTKYRAFGSQGLRCSVAVPLGGTVLTMTTVVGVTYAFRWWHWVETGRFQVVVDNGLTGSSRELLAESDIFKKGDKDQKTFKENYLAFTATTTSTKIWLQSPYGYALFFLDQVDMRKNPGLLEVSLLDNATGDVLASGTVLVSNTADYEDYDIDLHYYGAHVDGITTYALDIRPVKLDGADEIYWQLESDDAGSITSGALTYYNGSSWASGTGALKIDVYYNTSQEAYGLRMEQTSPVVQGADNREYVNAYLAGISSPQRRVSCTLDKQRSVLHAGIPTSGLGLLDVRMPNQGSTVNEDQIEQIEYAINDNGLQTVVTAGRRLPDLAYQLEWIRHKFQTYMGLNS